MIVALIPLFTLITETILFKKRPRPLVWVGAATALAGVWLVVQGSTEGDSLTGLFLMLGACLCWVAYNLLTDRLVTRLPILTVTCYQSLFSVLTLIPLTLTETVDWAAIPPSAWLWAAGFLGLICSALCYILYNHSIARLSAETTALFLNLNPIAAALGSVIILKEPMTEWQILGSVIVLLSLLLITRGGEKGKR